MADEDNNIDFLGLSDEEVLNMEAPPVVEEELPDEPTEEEELADAESDTEEEESTEEAEEEAEVEEEGDTEEEESDGDAFEESETEDETTEADKEEESSPNAEEELAKLFLPFKANNREMKVDNVEEARTLMQMGANYNKKMAAIKPNLKLMKMLDNNGLLDEGKLSYLIDLDKKNPEAITKLIKDSGIDPLNVDVEANTEYNPNTYTVDDKEVELDTALESIKDSPVFKDTIEILSNKWDESSKRVMFENPSLVQVINAHVENGIYEQINAVIEKERMLGRLAGFSDLEAYKAVGDQLQASGAFNDVAKKPQKEAPANVKIKPKAARKPEDPKLKDRKKAASPTKSAAKKSEKKDFNPLSLSDEEFEKISSSRFI